MSIEPTPASVELRRAEHAREALDNPLVAEALGAWEREITDAWKRSPLRDAEGRERLRLMLEAARQFEAHLRTTIETGQLARVQIEDKRSLLRRVMG